MDILAQVLIQYPAIGVMLYVFIELLKLMKDLSKSINTLSEKMETLTAKMDELEDDIKEASRRSDESILRLLLREPHD